MRKIEIGKIVNTHGIRGDVKLISYLDDNSAFDVLKTVMTKSGEYKIKGVKFVKGNPVLSLEGVDTPEKAETLKGTVLYVGEDELPALAEGEYYIKDILGLNAESDEGAALGKVTDVFRTGGNDVYEITGSDGKKILVPAVSDFIKEIDIPGKKMTVHIIEGLI